MFPDAFLKRMRQMLGSEYEDFLAALEAERHPALRLNPLKLRADGKSAAESLAKLAKPGEITAYEDFFALLAPVPWAENGYYYKTELQPGRHPCHEAGAYYIQEPSAMAPAECLDTRPGEKVLDLCAAPGGKSTQLAAKLKGRGFLLCNEIHPARARILSENIERMGVRNACVTNETPQRLLASFPAYFDKILVDAPCSGEGMFRKSETACEEWSLENVAMCAARQDEILDCAAGMLRPGGRLVYSTCTFAEEEDEGSVERFLTRHPDFRLLPAETGKTGLQNCEGRLPGTLKLMPHKVKGEGHFIALLEREQGAQMAGVPEAPPAKSSVRTAAMADARRKRAKAAENSPGISDKYPDEYLTFCRENLRCIPGWESDVRPIRFGDHLYLVPQEMPDMRGLRVLRPGLHLGELKKNRFEPSHALALALSGEEALRVLELDSADSRTFSYLSGETFPADGGKGWYLICVNGFSLGWGKLADGIMKNHYPKGLRRARMETGVAEHGR